MTVSRNTATAWAAGVAAYTIWGFMPLFWHLFKGVPAVIVFMHRCIWSFPFLVLLTVLNKSQAKEVFALDRGRLPWLALSGLLIGANWWIYIWGVEKQRVVEMSLGYFFSPLLTAALGVVVLRERLTLGQWLGVGLVMIGVIFYSATVGHFPWLAISLAATFSFYSLIRRWVRAAPLSALTSEAAVLFLIVVFYLLTSPRDPEFFQAWQTHSWLLVLSGVITALPLLWFSYAIRGLTLTSLGMINYISPTGKFIVAVMLLGEIVTVTEVWGFGFIWFGIAVYLAYTFKRSRAQPQPE